MGILEKLGLKKTKQTPVALPQKPKETIFEDEFSQLQIGLVGLCLEFAEQPVEAVYVYGSIEEKSFDFSAFFKINGQIVINGHMNKSVDYIKEFLSVGGDDLIRLKDICNKYQKPCPTEIKLYYDAKENRLETRYQYESVTDWFFNRYGKSPLFAWLEHVKATGQAF